MSPYTFGGGPSQVVARNRGYIPRVGFSLSTRCGCVVTDSFVQNAIVLELPLV